MADGGAGNGALPALFARLAAYNGWANRRIYAACAALSEADYQAGRPAFFGSIHGTLSHLLVADLLWLARLEGRAPPPLALDARPHPDLPALWAARQALDGQLCEHVAGLDDARLLGTVTYANTRGEPFANPRAAILQHLFNHHTHHRGQVHGMLSATPVPPPPLDLIFFVRETGA